MYTPKSGWGATISSLISANLSNRRSPPSSFPRWHGLLIPPALDVDLVPIILAVPSLNPRNYFIEERPARIIPRQSRPARDLFLAGSRTILFKLIALQVVALSASPLQRHRNKRKCLRLFQSIISTPWSVNIFL